MINVIDIFLTVVFLLLLAVPGFIFAKTKMFSKTASETLSTIVLYGGQPILVLTSFQACAYSPKIALNLLITVGVAILVHLLMFAIVKLAFAKRANP